MKELFAVLKNSENSVNLTEQIRNINCYDTNFFHNYLTDYNSVKNRL